MVRAPIKSDPAGLNPYELLSPAAALKTRYAVQQQLIFDVQIRDVPRYLTYMEKVRPALEAAGGRYLARGGAYTVTRARDE